MSLVALPLDKSAIILLLGVCDALACCDFSAI